MENEQTLTPRESLSLITSVINKTKDDIKEHSVVFLLWGWLLIAASIIRYLIGNFTEFKYFFIPYPLLSLIGIILTAIYYWRTKPSRAETYLSYFIKRLWMISTLGFLCVVAISVVQQIPPAPYTLVIAAIGTLVTGTVLKFRPLQYGGFLIFAASIVCALLPDRYKDLAHGAAFTVGYLIPGYMLKHSKA